mgnify:CR=1 FL=1
MEFLSPIIAFVGVFIGVLLKKIAQEEIKFGKFGGRYFIWMKRIILVLLIIFMLYSSGSYLYLLLGLVIGLILGIFLNEYLFLGLSMAAGFPDRNMLLVSSSLIFLYGLPYGSLFRKMRLNHILIITLLFFTPMLLLFFNVNQSLLVGLSAGGLFNYIIRK